MEVTYKSYESDGRLACPTKERAEVCPRIVIVHNLHSEVSISSSASSEPVLSMISRASDPTSEESVGRR